MGSARLTEWNMGAGEPVNGGIDLNVDFDPNSLSLSYTPTGTADGSADADNRLANKAAAQQTGQSSTLTVELTFDTSTTGTSVQEKTDLLVKLTLPDNKKRRVVQFSWGTFLFFGSVNTMSQTINYFSADGVPLRAVVNLTFAAVGPPNRDNAPASANRPSTPFGAAASVGFGVSAGIGLGAGASGSAGLGISAGASVSGGAGVGGGIGTTPLAQSRSGETIASLTARAGGGADWKAVASANGIDNPRMLAAGTVINPQACIEIKGA
ncbi:hypothetical protein MLP_22840 [Microlunatus phosphovorus NM-1]|uniref:Contractile injection system tube protein N-terminal domain-containing protein n=1 Tax=Microlunatus phosphovorus (strain ATCC 700054 / DSM 10555 / JCM 9379 / NBRC 101784 / NCIMB 13414 / VKM Ac-1990 / NM-1) TaxID=1032480 RepID=F5XET2_MICPN|nr:hypothetical protein [Microlunatus phosphovorus]BAK35298.1 hypothetical protein MLP_22840 [Microlunatus phosphovorus NM-1]